ncbi:MAG TPA: hypothetical protein VLI04_11960 [Nocardioidaceae bacterium]|nr:hypothetical protein [Nocardioidaceae bacterium]
MAICALLGARLVGKADDSVSVWAVRDDIVAGQSLSGADLEPVRVRFTEPADADRYISSHDDLPTGTVLLRGVGEGELLPRDALGTADDIELVELPITLPSHAVPATLRVGVVVDVWVTAQESERSVRVLEGVPVLALPPGGSSLSPSADRQVIVGLDEERQESLPKALALLASGTVVLTSRVTP